MSKLFTKRVVESRDVVWNVCIMATLLLLAITTFVLVGLGFSCAIPSFCFQFHLRNSGPSSNAKNATNVTITSNTVSRETMSKPAIGRPISDFDMSKRAMCWNKMKGVCLDEDLPSPFRQGSFDRTLCTEGYKCHFPNSTEKTFNYTTLINRKDCGQVLKKTSNYRITGGWTTPQWPWLVSIRLNGIHICSGIIVSNKSILTAQQCINSSVAEDNVTVVTGEYLLNKEDGTEVEFSVSNITRHANFSGTTLTNDVALLNLNGTIVMDINRQKICLPVVGDNFLTMQDNNGTNPDVCVVIGWGNGRSDKFREKMRMIASPLMDSSACQKSYVKTAEERKVDLNANICTYLKGYDVDSGDIGGPLFCDRDDHAVLVGVASWGRPNYPFVYSRVLSYKQWIEDNALRT